MKKKHIFVILIAIMTIVSPASAQITVKGHVVNERGEAVEYVSIGFEEDDGEHKGTALRVICDARRAFGDDVLVI